MWFFHGMRTGAIAAVLIGLSVCSFSGESGTGSRPADGYELRTLPNSFTADLLDLKRGKWTFKSVLGWDLALNQPALAYAFTDAPLNGLKLGYLRCDPEFPDDPAHAELRELSPVSKEGGALLFRIDEPYFKADVKVTECGPGVRLCRVENVRLGPVSQGDRYVGALKLLAGGQSFPLWLAPDQDETGLNPRLCSGRVGSVFTAGEKVELSYLTGKKPDAADAITVAVNDYATGKPVWSGNIPAAFRPGEPKQIDFDLPLNRFGVFEVSAKAPGLPEAKIRICRIPERQAIDPEKSFMGINIFQHQIWWYAYQAPMMAKAGIRWIRPWLGWENTWTMQAENPSQLDTRALDSALRRLDLFGMRYQYLLTGCPQRLSSEGRVPVLTRIHDNLGEWRRYVEQLTTRYRDKIDYWEVLNEPDGTAPADYFEVLKASFETIRKTDPGSKVIGLSMSGRQLAWFTEVWKLGAGKYLDIASLHIYDKPGPGFKDYAERVIEGMGGDIPLWINEFGSSAYDFSPEFSQKYNCSERTQAEWIPAWYALSLAADPKMKIFLYCTHDPMNPAGHFAWDAGIGVMYQGFLPKLSYASLAATARELDGRECLGFRTVADGVHLVTFSGPVTLAWRDSGDKRPAGAVALGCGPNEEITVNDMFGNRIFAGRAAEAKIDFSQGPAYIHGSAALDTTARANSALKVGRKTITLREKETVSIPVLTCSDEIAPEVKPAARSQLKTALKKTGEKRFELEIANASGKRFSPELIEIAARIPAGLFGLDSARTVKRSIQVIPANYLLYDPMENLGNWNMERNSPVRIDPAAGRSAPGSMLLEGPFNLRCVHYATSMLSSSVKTWKFRMWVKSANVDPKSKIAVSLSFFGGSKWPGARILAGTPAVPETIEPRWRAFAGTAKIPLNKPQWTCVEAEFPAAEIPEGATSYAILIDLSVGKTGRIWIDDMELSESSEQ